MAFSTLTSSQRSNTGVGRYPDFADVGRIVKCVFAESSHSFETATAAETLSNWTTDIKDKELIPLPFAKATEWKGKDPVMEDFVSGEEKVNDGVLGWDFTFTKPITIHQRLKTLDSMLGRVFLIDETGKILGTSSDGTLFQGFGARIFVNPYKHSDGTQSGKTIVGIRLTDVTEFEGTSMEYITPTNWQPLDLDGIHDVDLSATSVTSAVLASTGLVATVWLDHFLSTDANGAVKGLAKDDFVLKKGTDVVSITSYVDNGDGTYNLLATSTAGEHTVDLVAVGSVSLTTLIIESTAAATSTIS